MATMQTHATGASTVRWSVQLETLTVDGRTGEQSFIVEAIRTAEAEQLAWEQAHTPDAARKRRHAEITTRREELHASVLDDPLFAATRAWGRGGAS
jgi:hypothetical protein